MDKWQSLYALIFLLQYWLYQIEFVREAIPFYSVRYFEHQRRKDFSYRRLWEDLNINFTTIKSTRSSLSHKFTNKSVKNWRAYLLTFMRYMLMRLLLKLSRLHNTKSSRTTMFSEGVVKKKTLTLFRPISLFRFEITYIQVIKSQKKKKKKQTLIQ